MGIKKRECEEHLHRARRSIGRGVFYEKKGKKKRTRQDRKGKRKEVPSPER